MKHPFRKLLALGLCAVLAAALFPSASAAKPEDLRRVAANQAKALASINWRLEKRSKVAEFTEVKTQALHNTGVRPTYYYEYIRLQSPYVGAIMDNTSGSYEQIMAQLTDDGLLPESAMLPDAPLYTYYGMNADAFLVDVVSRVSPTPISGVKQAISSGALTPLVSGVDFTAATSKLAAPDKQALIKGYGELEEGDLVIAWDDTLEVGTLAPTLHVMVVSGLDVDGTATFTYPSYAQPLYSFTCTKCGAISTEGPTSSVLPKHVISKDYAFAGFTTHASVDSSSGCSGKWRPNGGTTWRTETVSMEKLLGDETFTEGGVCYIPFTLPVYSGGAPEVKVTLDTQTTADNLMSGFSGTIHSNYRITRVDAVLSTTGSADQVFTHYPAYDAWSYEFQDSGLNRALSSASSGGCSLTVTVHSGPITNFSTMKTPVTQVLDLSSYLSEPDFKLDTDVTTAHQGHSVPVYIKPCVDNITAAKVELTFDRDFFAFDAAKTRSTNKNCTFSENADGSVTITYSGPAATKNATLATLYFTPHRTGSFPVSPDKTGTFTARSAWKATAANPTLIPTRFGGEPVSFGIGYNLKVFENYAAGKSLILFGVEETPVKATYGEQMMVDVTDAKYTLDGKGFTHTYAIITDSADLSLVKAEAIDASPANVLPGMLYYDLDVNRSGGVNIRDAQAAANIMAGRTPLEGNLEKWLIADVDVNGKIDTNDIRAILAAANK